MTEVAGGGTSPDLQKVFGSCHPDRGTLVTIGVFDGVHLGHQHLIGYLRRQAMVRDLQTAVVTFCNHPLSVLSPQTLLPRLMPLEERQVRLRELGLDFVLAVPFTKELAALEADAFVELLIANLKMQGLVVGPDFALGKDRKGDVFHLHALAKKRGFTVDVVQPLTMEGGTVSSTAIRRALAAGDVEKANRFLGHPFRVGGKIIAGSGRGRQIGFPTANIDIEPDRAIPGNGVYVTRAHLGRQVYGSLTNIGNRPTFDNGARSVEVYLLDYQGDLYGKHMEIEIIKRLRGEVRFASPAELKTQIDRDIALARSVLE